MRFVCDSCRAQYMISDEKVGAKGVKVRCKKCGYVILVRRAEATPPPEPDGEATQVMQLPFGLGGSLGDDPEVTAPGGASAAKDEDRKESGLFSGVEEDEIGAVFDSVLNSGSHKLPSGDEEGGEDDASGGLGLGESPDDRMSTRVLDGETMRKLAAESGVSVGNGAETAAAAAPAQKVSSAADFEWYVAVDEKQEGPLALDKVKALWESGEIGPDSLAWRGGMPDWIPVSEITELATALAPRPSKPVIVAPEPSTPAPVIGTMPVESAFNAGGVSRTVRSDVPVVAAGPAAENKSGWKPSAASALASLVQEEIQVLSKPPPKAEEPAPSALPGLLDLPSQPEAGRTPTPPPAAVVAQAPVIAPAPVAAAPFGASPYGGAPAAYVPYAPQKSKTGLYIGLGAGALLVLVIAIFGAAAMMKDDGPGTPAPVAAPTPPAAEAPTANAAAAKAEAEKAALAKAEAEKAEAAAKAEAEAKAKAEAEAKAKAEAEAKAKEEEKPVAVAKAPVRRSAPTRTTRRDRNDDADGETITARRTERDSEPSGTKDEFDSIFGGGSSSSTKSSGSSGSSRSNSVYIPPAPGSADVPDSLGQSDIMQVVLANRAALGRCSANYKKEVGGASGKIAMRWTILTSGKTSGVTCTTPELKSSSLASCLAGEIRKMKFPSHKRQGAPINFPFTY